MMPDKKYCLRKIMSNKEVNPEDSCEHWEWDGEKWWNVYGVLCHTEPEEGFCETCMFSGNEDRLRGLLASASCTGIPNCPGCDDCEYTGVDTRKL
jgi:hypothetical protein